ncbi:DUF3794 domain-containing protein [Pelosinus sp. sgz500959]|uniref:DUF3794 domain-containing protein n=1 Tax=Pelosinus sp. sgz500959 TaxID=3242472 RepID=UPI00366C7B82
MDSQPIEIFGITPPSHFPQCPPHHPCTQFCESDTLYLPSRKIKIENIRQVCLKVLINSFKIICTPVGNKLVINGKKQIKVLLSSNPSHQALYSIDFEIPFCTFILLKELQGDVVDVYTVVEDISVQCINPRSITIASVIFICPIVKKDHQLCPPPPPPISQSICTHCHSYLNPT